MDSDNARSELHKAGAIMSKFIQTNTIKERLKCPKCHTIMYREKHKAQDAVCKVCGWAHSFKYIDEGEE